MAESPLDQVPFDVVSEILRWACYMPPLSSSYPPGTLTSRHTTKGIFSPDAMQWSLSRVCRDWRSLVLSYPALWSELQVHVHPQLGHRYVFTLELVLARSANHALDVEIIDLACDGDEASKPVESSSTKHEIIVRLFAESHRWRSAELHFRGRAPDKIVNLLQGRLPRLESLVLAVVPEPLRIGIGFPLSIPTIRAFADCPYLRVVDIPVPCATDIHWNLISRYRCTRQDGTVAGSRWPLDSYLTNVGECQALESLSYLDTCFHNPARSRSSLMVTNSSIRRLEVACAVILDHLILPELTDAKIVRIRARDESGGPPPSMDGVFESLEKLLLRSNRAHKITRLTLVDVSITSHAFVSAIAHMENLEELHINATPPEATKDMSFDTTPRITVNHSNNTLKKLFANLTNREKIWLPRLRVFSLSVVHDGAFPFIASDVELVRLLQFRRKGSMEPAMVKLQNFRLVQHTKNLWNPSKSIRKDLQALVDDGIILTVRVSAEADGLIVGS
ncbi:hypothetical protein BDZ89DRAFT_1066148 [Hymenopellis radicata]|nr:hypothetical protein BDZ89DRAFT_1066148 [Hymenopellis radicata]